MNRIDLDILKHIYKNKYTNQRELSKLTGYSLGAVNKAIKNLLENEYIDENINLTNISKKLINDNRPKSAIILSAGFGMRMVPINVETPKALLEVNGEVLIERTIRQLREKGINKIFVVVGFLKEKFEYLIDKFGVELIINPQYATKNNLFSLNLVLENLDNSYIIPCDILCKENPFNEVETYSWYMVTDELDENSTVKVNKKNNLVCAYETENGNKMIGISYLCGKEADFVKKRVSDLVKFNKNRNLFWESALTKDNKFLIYPKLVSSKKYFEINTYEQLREIDSGSNNLQTDAINIICDCLNVGIEDIKEIKVLKKGMTNRSFIFTVKGEKYIMRIPGEGTSELIDRKQEAQVYSVIKDKGICDDLVYINPENGYKITKFIENSRTCDDKNNDDLKKCMEKIKLLHSLNLKVNHEFDIFEKINFYESLWKNKKSIYSDYKDTKEKIFSLKDFIEKNVKTKCLAHIDANCDNFLFSKDSSLRLIDWEYASMQDPDIDIAMFCIYSLYDKKQIDNLIDIYFEGGVPKNTKIKIYAYIACCGLLWSNWCEYKLDFGVEFGEYSLKQYRYAKDYYKIVKELLGEDF